MSAQMLSSKDIHTTGKHHTHQKTVLHSFLLGESLDEMQLLEEQAFKIAEEAARDQPKKSMTFVK